MHGGVIPMGVEIEQVWAIEADFAPDGAARRRQVRHALKGSVSPIRVRISLNWPRQSARNGHPGSGFWPPPRRPRQRPTRGVRFIP